MTGKEVIKLTTKDDAEAALVAAHGDFESVDDSGQRLSLKDAPWTSCLPPPVAPSEYEPISQTGPCLQSLISSGGHWEAPKGYAVGSC
ncbi:hypothetical protein CKM354_000460700 [Cercospora kikuchii]|uniref:Uncharacterized protein n=1 Tax=Cercospora kikuchii TaxID=84275 RepID=A0A9P3FES3_9PEZI|nr:uncharacterized protein CKM354_000460700 [Cercospora kikuchii]GIZ41297.1 hypothetical protein CKM354_000460700 [Cercospora kikuchii]